MKPLFTQVLAMSAGMAVTVASTTIDPMVLAASVADAICIGLMIYTFTGMIKRREW